MRRIAMIFAATLIAAPTVFAATEEAAVTDCDRLAASPFDPGRPKGVPGAMLSSMDGPAAVTACLAAAKAKPQDPRTVYQLGRALRAAKKYDNARTAYRLADSFGHPLAAMELGQMNEQGIGGSRDLAEARRLYEKSAANGSAMAMVFLGNMYQTGNGAPKDEKAARTWYTKAARAGIGASMNGLGMFYERGAKRDLAAAQRWYAKAAAAGDKDAADNLQRLRAADAPRNSGK